MTAQTGRAGFLLSIAGLLACVTAGCDSASSSSLEYTENPAITTNFNDPNRPDLHDKPPSQKAVRDALTKLFGPRPSRIIVPEGSGFREGGRYLAKYAEVGEGANAQLKPVQYKTVDGKWVTIEGGYGLYRKHCIHCHGSSGDGGGPTAAFLYPRPRDYRKGLFKFTSTNTGAKPTRKDLDKTIRYGLHGTSMPAFESLMDDGEINQVIDYVIFLSIRGETEQALIEETYAAGELSAEAPAELLRAVINKWNSAESQVLNPPIPRPPSTRESILRGKDLFLSLNTTGNKIDCTSCHGPQAEGNGPSFVGQDVFNEVVFGGDPSEAGNRLAHYDQATRDLWKNSLDDWGNPIRPANLNRGVYKGGRRPIDIYWRIAKGINGAKMPAHATTIEPPQIWDLVNFVLALPYEPRLLEGAKLPDTPPATAPKVAARQ